jgi:hypothetical protein
MHRNENRFALRIVSQGQSAAASLPDSNSRLTCRTAPIPLKLVTAMASS